MSNRLLKNMLGKKDFNKLLGKMTALWHRRDFDNAKEILQRIILHGDVDMQSQALLYRGMIKQDEGLLADARQDWLDAKSLANEGTFTLYLIQHNLGASYQRENLDEDAISWYRLALQTCIEANDFSCDQTLSSFLSVSHGDIPKDDEMRVIAAVETSWRVLGLPGLPNLTSLPFAINSLDEGFKRLLAETENGV
jgi:tetratricopeptide (TPR) repeat protein